ncbi:DUF982 domain-containing protein [Arvimicrobium flavum]|uniref:DUF982 domain-containing protein n=1 Tax=Arvimicrobium flavum TaxID=3393320 RepID=UPI00237AD68D|nr:DUF982 domain-containing protein [Mesorhizobium shangrilense]
MTKHMFERPVRVQAGDSNTLRDVRSVEGACEVLIDWPHARRGPFYQSALEVVNAALEGKASVEEARAAFADLCAHAGALVGESGDPDPGS